jgi:EAL domain-containing protein (putative c-di-GMP-specific phosphodiesterase class I)
MDAEVRARVSMEAELGHAITAGQLFLMYQPQIEIDTGRIIGLEALVRWHHPSLGTLAPASFIPAAERSGLIVPLGRWVLREACRQAGAWRDAGLAPLPIAVNLSSVQFKRPLELQSDIAAALAEFDLPPKLLELEMTENVLMRAARDHTDVVLRLREAGHRIVIDDFGTGYSSIDYLRRHPVDRIKIAQSFAAELGHDRSLDATIRAALGLACALDVEVVVEGVETAAQRALLQSWGCRLAQGYYFAAPLPASEGAELLRAGRLAAAPITPVEVAA